MRLNQVKKEVKYISNVSLTNKVASKLVIKENHIIFIEGVFLVLKSVSIVI